ncbi:D-2-hydroxyacid dehydrogenase [Paenibacillus sp. NPDC056722]|uniref:D-2-hydroxyacid dehydrogenase n=1 Tax=Paenibacillus sp. NPDC056722 TaxID=3345924 RepID=UPI0036AA5042
MTKSIVCLQPLTPSQQAKIREAAPGYTLELGSAKEPDLQQLASAEIVIGWAKGVGEALLDGESQLRWVQSWSAGIDKMPLQCLQERGVLLTTASGVHAEPIAAVIFGFILSFTRNLHKAVLNQSKREWHSYGNETELSGKTAVIFGTGAIGGETARIAKAFRMKTVGVSRTGKPAAEFNEVFQISQWQDAVSQGDFVINTLPLTDDTHHLFNAAVFSAFKEGSYYINIGRGGTTHTGDLIEALQSGHIRGAGLDVFETEPLPQDHPLWGMEQVIITPHSAGNTDRYTDRIVDIITENLKSYIATGSPSLNKVDYSQQY